MLVLDLLLWYPDECRVGINGCDIVVKLHAPKFLKMVPIAETGDRLWKGPVPASFEAPRVPLYPSHSRAGLPVPIAEWSVRNGVRVPVRFKKKPSNAIDRKLLEAMLVLLLVAFEATFLL